ncbi:hypothetical protein SAMN02745823_01729 [Sporobacter termitidis DSM 10068]|uniref:DUF2149 domain-containing protein n=1 Tax=Sporobacter termitidis DSM 10068 TaxID=1123282 RepID=A0A1M5XDF5_9FIRM|nr:DUF2149 domain-containing protein [Sporobacter termitidis]SHH97887.1 hypothetical protein SAMN02745823_01729 [Sporobacter termitidis DSM 10068]
MRLRRFGNGRLNRGEAPAEDVNPLDGLANLADIMLVLACGLMLALIINWNVDIAGAAATVPVQQGQEVTQDVGGLTQDGGQDMNDDTKYEKMGVVYKDPATGKLYLVTNDGGAG